LTGIETLKITDLMAQYEYRPLDRERDEIRLVRLLPGAFDDEMQIEVFHTQLSSDWPSHSDSSRDDMSDNENTGSEFSEYAGSDEEATNQESSSASREQSRKLSPSGEEPHPKETFGSDGNIERHLGTIRTGSPSSRGVRSDLSAANGGNSDEDSSDRDSLSDDDATSEIRCLYREDQNILMRPSLTFGDLSLDSILSGFENYLHKTHPVLMLYSTLRIPRIL
jgi:hypothetical protein